MDISEIPAQIDESCFRPLSSGGGLSNFLSHLDKQLEKNSREFQEQLNLLQRRGYRGEVDFSSLTERIRVLENEIRAVSNQRTKLESQNIAATDRIRELETENEILARELEKSETRHQGEMRRIEKRLILANTENSRLKVKMGNGRPTTARQSSPPRPTVDREKYRRALMYIDELQKRLRSDSGID